MQKPRLFITGINGLIGRILQDGLADVYEIWGLDIAGPFSERVFQTDIADYDQTLAALSQAVPFASLIHLAVKVDRFGSWESVLPTNIIGTRNVFEAARQVGVKKIIFASSAHVTGAYDGFYPAGYRHKLHDPPRISVTDPIRPDGEYGVSKVFGEALARYYASRWDISFICLRIGAVMGDDRPVWEQRHKKIWLSYPDLLQLVQRSLDSTMVFGIYYGMSNNAGGFWDITNARLELGYEPQDDAADYWKIEMIKSPRDWAVTLRDGRALAYAEYGDPGGRPLFYFHGGNSSRLEGAWFDEAAAANGVRLIAPDRPGFGRSSPHPHRRLLSWADDMHYLANALNLDQFALLGLSGGGPHVAAVAHALPDRVTAAAIVSGVAPPQMPGRFNGMFPLLRLNFFFARYAPWLNKIFLSQMAGSYDDPERFLQMVQRGMPQPDKDLAERRPEVIHQFSAAAVEGHRQGLKADQQEWGLYARPWRFDLADIDVPVHLWYGEVDNFAPVGMGHYLAAQIPGSRLHIVPDGGHFSTINNYIDEILAGLV